MERRRRATVGRVPGIVAAAVLAAVLAAPVTTPAAPAASAAAAATPAVAFAFTVVAPRSVSPSQLVARAIIESPGVACPPVVARTARGATRRIPMVRIPPPDGSLGFDDVTVCRAALPAGLVRASVGGRRLPLLPSGTLQRIAVFGDTGCRIKSWPPTTPGGATDYEIQDCADTRAWPLQRAAEEIAAARPDLIVDTGDYFYRESDCPAIEPYASMCAGSPPVNPAGSPNEDTYAGWRADWFAPARALFSTAPLVLARGNHEQCSRAGTGFFFLVDPGVAPPDTCQRMYAAIYDPENPTPDVAEPTWVARLGSIDLVMLDTSSSDDSVVTNAETYTALGRRAASLLRPSGATGWLVSHAPVYGWERFGGPGTDPVWTSVTLQTALDGVIRPFAAVFSGHLHIFQTVRIPGRPVQLTFGDGGTLLDPADQGGTLPAYGPLTQPGTGGPLLASDGSPVAPGIDPIPAPTGGVTTFTFGWALFRPARAVGTFTGVRYRTWHGPWARCTLRPQDVACTPVGGPDAAGGRRPEVGAGVRHAATRLVHRGNSHPYAHPYVLP